MAAALGIRNYAGLLGFMISSLEGCLFKLPCVTDNWSVEAAGFTRKVRDFEFFKSCDEVEGWRG